MHGALAEALSTALRDFGPATALSGSDMDISYGHLGEQAQAVATALAGAGLQADEPVHLQVSNHPLDIAALLGIWLAGGVAVPVHRTTPPSVAAMFQQRSQARWQLDLQPGMAPGAALSILAPHAPAARPLLQGAALVVFTSGSTGVPKGVVVAHEAFLGKMRQIDSLLKFLPGDKSLLVLNITFSFGLWVSLLTLLSGGTLVMHSKFEPGPFLDTLARGRITRVGMVPTMMRVLFADAKHEAAMRALNDQASLRQIMIGGESLGRSLADTIRARFANTTLVDIYGLTETATCDFFAFPADYARFPGAIGRPSPNVQYRIADATGRPLASGDTGELQIRSPYLMRGYLDDPDLTTAAYDDGWFKTGDLGRVLGGQVVELMGRQKEVISRAGNKVTPVEIEQALCSHADVAAAMAVGVDDPLLGQTIHVLVVPRDGQAMSTAQLRDHLESRLERFKHPDRFYSADALPLGRTGKADRGQLKAHILAGDVKPLAT